MRLFILLTLLLFSSFDVACYEKLKLDHSPTLNFVIDNEEILTSSESKKLQRLLEKHERKTSNEIVILTTANHKPFSNLREYSIDYFNKKGIGKVEKNNGVLIAVEKGNRRIEIVNGYGIEAILSDEKTLEIIDASMTPYFKKGNYYKGLTKGVKSIIEKIK